MSMKFDVRVREWLALCFVVLVFLVLWINNTYWNPHVELRSVFGNVTFLSDLTDVIDIEEGEITEVKMSFVYTGNTTAKVLEIKTEGDCGCTKLEISAHDLFSGQDYSLNLTYDSRGQSEGIKETKILMRVSEGDEEQTIAFSLPLRVHRRIILNPQTINLGEVSASTAIDRTIQIKIIGDYDCRKIMASSSVDTLHAEIIPLPNQQQDQTEGFSFADLRITGSISPNADRISERVFLTFPSLFGLDRNKNVILYGVVETRVRIVPATLFLGFLEIGVKKDIDFVIITSSASSVEVLGIESDEKAVFTKYDDIKVQSGSSGIRIAGSVMLNENAIQDTSLKLKILLMLDGERIEQELPCVYLVNKEKQ